jgi:DNA-directed RNA polymerase specialized sigma24 family protein
MSGSIYCRHHDPDHQESVKKARLKGGLNNRLSSPEAAPASGLTQEELESLGNLPENPKELREFLAKVTAYTIANKITSRQAGEVRQMVKLMVTLPKPDPEENPADKLTDKQLAEELRKQLRTLESKIEAEAS